MDLEDSEESGSGRRGSLLTSLLLMSWPLWRVFRSQSHTSSTSCLVVSSPLAAIGGPLILFFTATQGLVAAQGNIITRLLPPQVPALRNQRRGSLPSLGRNQVRQAAAWGGLRGGCWTSAAGVATGWGGVVGCCCLSPPLAVTHKQTKQTHFQ